VPGDDWTRGRYVRVFADLQDRHPGVWTDDRLLAWYVRLLDQADASWPGSPLWPRALPEDVEEALVEAGAIDAKGDAYQVHGLDRLRLGAAARGRAGGMARAKDAPRDRWGRMLGSHAGPSNGDAGSHAGPDAGAHAGAKTLEGPLDVQRPSDQTRHDTPLQGVSGLDARTPEDQDQTRTIECDDYRAHQSDHRQIGGRWVCVVCEKARAAVSPSLKDRVGWDPAVAPSPPSKADRVPHKTLATPARDAIRDRLGYVPGEEAPPDDDRTW
jgi:hypothetical protein